jgi:bifunctional UDP-N-acetylglucosamine pyrophosphorylase/glucosamine-1-phosphate N-acetyltransferase
VKAVILAAGKGTRLQPITDHCPKHLLEIAGIPILKRILDGLLALPNIDQCRVVLNYQSEQIEEALEQWYTDDRIEVVYQKEVLGTGDAVREGLKDLEITDPFLVVNGDVLMNTEFSSILKQMDDGDDGLVVGAQVPDPSSFGVFTIDTNQYLLGLQEKPEGPIKENLVNAGFYIFPPSASKYFKQLEFSERGERELTDVLIRLLEEGNKIKVVETEYWFDIGRPWQLLDANEFFMKQELGQFQIMGTVEDGAHLHGQIHVAKTARIRSGVYIEGPAYIDEGADIGPNCYIRAHSYLGKNTRVGNACEIKNSIIYHDSHAAHLSYVGDSIIGRSCNLGAGTITANLRHDGKTVRVTVKDERVDSGRRKIGVIMGDNTKTGIGVNILPGVRISSGTWLNAGEIVVRDR